MPVDGVQFSLFDTRLGTCALAWSDYGICGLALPCATSQATQARLLRHHASADPGIPSHAVARAVEGIQRLFLGRRDDLDNIALDLRGVGDFDRRIYAATRAIPPGRTRTYGDIATAVGAPGAARAVGRALGANPVPIIVPCHRVVAAAGKSGGFSGPGGVEMKLRMLSLEGDGTFVFDAPPATAMIDTAESELSV